MLPSSLPTSLGAQPDSTPVVPGDKAKTITGSVTPAGTLQVRNRGRIFGRPGLVVVTVKLPGTVSVRIRRN